MEDYKCAFATPLVSGKFGCVHAKSVVRRGGPDIACQVYAGHERCTQLLERLKAVALPALGFEDDPLSMPHSALVKIQAGGLLGLQRRLTGSTAETVMDINALVESATARNPDEISLVQLAEDITSYKVRRHM